MSVLNWSTKRSNSSKSSKVYAWVRLKLRILLLLVLPTKNRTRRLVSISNPFARCFSIRPTASSIRCPQLPYFHGQHLPGFFVYRERLEVAARGRGEERQALSLHAERNKPHIQAFVVAASTSSSRMSVVRVGGSTLVANWTADATASLIPTIH